MTTNNQPYQGYPYINPVGVEAPTIDAVQAARWANLPRRAISTAVAGPSGSGGGRGNPPPTSDLRPPKDVDENPVVYIDVPEAGTSEVTQVIEVETEPEFVQDTILYDPFENRRIVPKEDGTSEQSSVSDGQSLEAGSPLHLRPDPPSRLNWMDQGSSSYQTTPNIPPFMSKESNVYNPSPSDNFPLTPVRGVSGFPEPPPAYTEVAPPRRQTPPAESTASEAELPRTQVIVPSPDPVSAVGIMSFERKFVVCQHCGSSVHTLVVRETGCMTFLIFTIMFLVLLPLAFIIFFVDTFKHKNHYCPNCNRLIGYQLPVCSSELNAA